MCGRTSFSGTGYNFLKNVNAWGGMGPSHISIDFAENVYQFTSSGSGPVNALVPGEAAMGLGFQAVSEINQSRFGGHVLRGGALHGRCTGIGMRWPVAGSSCGQGDGRVVYRGVRIDNALYVPDQVLVDYKAEIDHYPRDAPRYADILSMNPDEKKKVLEKWKY